MGLSKKTRIWVLLGIDSAFFLLELIVGEYAPFYVHSSHDGKVDKLLGYGVHSLALVADSFHMVRSTCLPGPQLASG